jgi:hypothetical protein
VRLGLMTTVAVPVQRVGVEIVGAGEYIPADVLAFMHGECAQRHGAMLVAVSRKRDKIRECAGCTERRHPHEQCRHTSKAGSLSNGVKGPFSVALATTRVIVSTEAMLTVGYEAPCRLAALACRIESPDHIGKTENSRQDSGTSDASTALLRLTGS